jgi:hypothetical protein
MTNRRLFLVGAAGIAGLLAAGLAGVALLGPPSGPRPTELASPAPAGGGAAPSLGAAQLPVAAAPVPSPELEAAVAPARRRPSAPADTRWDGVPIAARPYDLGPELARPVAVALDAARGDMEPCFQEEERALAQGRGPRFDPRDPPTSAAVLVLRMESREGTLEVVDTELDSLGTSTRALATCCQRVLKGWSIAAPLAAPGRRFRLKYLLD